MPNATLTTAAAFMSVSSRTGPASHACTPLQTSAEERLWAWLVSGHGQCSYCRSDLQFLWPTGKTTLLRIMAGTDEADGGSVKRIDGVRVGYLEQDPQMDPE